MSSADDELERKTQAEAQARDTWDRAERRQRSRRRTDTADVEPQAVEAAAMALYLAQWPRSGTFETLPAGVQQMYHHRARVVIEAYLTRISAWAKEESNG